MATASGLDDRGRSAWHSRIEPAHAAGAGRLIGTTRETLAHTIGEFRRRGVVTTDQQRVVITNAERLLDVAQGTSD